MCGGFILAWFPYALVCLLEVIDPGLVSPRLSAAPALLAKSAGIYNPLIYFMSSKKFKSQTLAILGKFMIRSRQVNPGEAEDGVGGITPIRPFQHHAAAAVAVAVAAVANDNATDNFNSNNMVLKSCTSTSKSSSCKKKVLIQSHSQVLVPRDATVGNDVANL